MPKSAREKNTLEKYKASRARFGEWQWCLFKESELPNLKPGFATRKPTKEQIEQFPEMLTDMIQVHIRHGYCPCADCVVEHTYMYECEDTDTDRKDGTTEECCHNICT